jgi:UDP-3-O-[3-hydroxymyristoyl] glucosamine N-acyltransferase
MAFKLAELAELVSGRLTGDGQLLISGAATIADANEKQITLADRCSLIEELNRSAACAAIVCEGVVPRNKSYITVDDARSAFEQVVRQFSPGRRRKRRGISPAAVVNPEASLGEDVEICPLVTIEEDVQIGPRCTIHSGAVIMAGCRLGSDVTIYPNAVLYPDTVVGDRVIIHAGAVIGADGFGFEAVDGKHVLCPQLGHVEIGPDVIIGACTTIDRGTYSPTRIGEGTKIDNQVMIGHNCQIGRHNLLCAQVGIAGSVTTGQYVVMGGQVGVRDHVRLADGVQLGAKSGVGESILEAGKYLGAPAIPVRKEIQILLSRHKIPEMRKRIAKLEERAGGNGKTE